MQSVKSTNDSPTKTNLTEVEDPIALRKEADALEDDYGWIDRLIPDKVAVVADQLRWFADGG